MRVRYRQLALCREASARSTTVRSSVVLRVRSRCSGEIARPWARSVGPPVLSGAPSRCRLDLVSIGLSALV